MYYYFYYYYSTTAEKMKQKLWFPPLVSVYNQSDASLLPPAGVLKMNVCVCAFADGEKEAGEQNEEGSAERRVPGAARQAETLLQNRQRLQRGTSTQYQYLILLPLGVFGPQLRSISYKQKITG